MAAMALRSVTVKPRLTTAASLYLCPLFASRSFSRLPAAAPSCRLPHLRRVRPLVALVQLRRDSRCSAADRVRCFSTSGSTSPLNDPSPNWSHRPPKETILLDGCDFEHWLVVVDPPEASLTRDEIIKSYIQTLAKVVGSEEEARMKIYAVSTKHYFAFGALVSEEISYKIKEIPGVRWVLPDSYLDVKNKDYGGEPFINGEAVPYDPKYHEEWVRNNARANERNRRNDRPRNFDRSRNFERRRDNMQNFQNRGPPVPPPPPSPVQNQQFANQGSSNPAASNSVSEGYQQQGAAQNPVTTSGGPNLNMGGLPNLAPNVGLPNPNFRDQNLVPNNGGGYGPNFGGYPTQVPGGATGSNLGGFQTQMPDGAPNPNYPRHQNQRPNQNYGGGAYQGSHSGYQGYPSGGQGHNPGGFAGNPPPNYQGNPGPYQGSPNAYQGGATEYSSGNSYRGNGTDQFQPREIPGRD